MGLPTQGEPPSEGAIIAVRAWNLMGAQIDMAAMPFICELFGVHDVESFYLDLVAIRDHLKAS